MKPRIPITSRAFVYRKAVETDLRKTFAEARQRMEAERAAGQNKITTIRKRS
jgi:hypothetical protein